MRTRPRRSGNIGGGLGFATLVAFALLASSSTVAAHSGGPLDAAGCHRDRRVGNYHCHSGPAAGHTFRGPAEMQEAVRTGNFPEGAAQRPGPLRRLWSQHGPRAVPGPGEEGPPGSAPSAGVAAPSMTAPAMTAPSLTAPATATTPAMTTPATAPAQATTTPATAPSPATAPVPATGSASAPAPAPETGDFEHRLRVLEDLRAKGLVTESEYQAKRRAILEEL